MPRGKTTPERKDELVGVAAKLFRERGYEATSMQEIADHMGILKGSLYHYVRTKEDLLWVVMEPPLRNLVEAAERILGDDAVPIGDRLVRVMEAHAESFEENHPHMAVMTQENGATLSDERRKDLDVLRRRYFDLLRSTVVAGQASGEISHDVHPSMAVHAIFGMLNWMFRWYTPEGPLSARDVADEFAKIVISGLVTAPHQGASGRDVARLG